MTDNKQTPFSYQNAGVDIQAGNQLVERIKHVAKKTRRPEVLSGLGGFGALFELPKGYQEPVLVSGTDGVGTKLRLAIELNRHNTVGIDLVAMCVNDLLVTGAEPLYFLDYYATGKLDIDTAAAVIDGIGRGCEQAGCALIGGETAEMPGMYEGEDYDLAGFCVGIVEKSAIIDGHRVKAGNTLIAIPSSGPHSNGFSLIRQIIDIKGIDINMPLAGKPLGEALLEPTRIYVKQLLALIKASPVHAMAHITGGGLTENIPRVLPDGTKAVINTNTWQLPPVFEWLKQEGKLDDDEMHTTFNCGVGMIIVVPDESARAALTLLNAQGDQAFIIGQVESSDTPEPFVEYRRI